MVTEGFSLKSNHHNQIKLVQIHEMFCNVFLTFIEIISRPAVNFINVKRANFLYEFFDKAKK